MTVRKRTVFQENNHKKGKINIRARAGVFEEEFFHLFQFKLFTHETLKIGASTTIV